MIKFFRAIRQKLLSESKFNKYLVYAIGEIVLVMIGILLALQVNNWNERSKNENRKEARLKEIHYEFVHNQEELKKIKKEHELCHKGAKKIAAMFPINLETINLDSLSSYMREAFGNWTYDPFQTRIKSFVESSDFNLVEDKALREILIGWESIYEDYHEDEQRALSYNDNYFYPYLQTFLPVNRNLKDPRFDPTILTSIEFENSFNTRLRNLSDILYNETDELIKLENTIQKIIDLTKPFASVE